MNQYQEFIYYTRYSRFMHDQKRREHWSETVQRYADFMIQRVPKEYRSEYYDAIAYVLESEIVPSMRALWTAGKALERENIAAYNCAYTPIDRIKAFAEHLYILMNGTGSGFSVESKYISQLPVVPESLVQSTEEIVFKDSKRGWAEGYYRFMKGLYEGKLYKLVYDKIRPRGSILKTFGGRASGPEPLMELCSFTESTFRTAKGRRLSPQEAHDICCMIGNCVVVGGVRRSACISLSDLEDSQMARSKSGNWYENYKYREMANNSAVYTYTPDARKFLSEWLKLIESKSGERGIFNRKAAQLKVASIHRRNMDYEFGCNPCGEIILRPNEFCNLTEVILKPDDFSKDILQKVRYTTILGVVQSTLTNFNFINSKFASNCEEERLLGVSLTGLADHPILNHVNKDAKKLLMEAREEAIETATEWAGYLGINVPAAITCVKPSGTVSQLMGCSSGISPRHAKYYVRRVRNSRLDPVTQFMIDSGFNAIPDIGREEANVVFEFPIKSPENSITRNMRSAVEQCEYWSMLQRYWCEHNPSCTIYVEDSEWIDVGAWLYKNFNSVSGLTFFPKTDHVYKLAPEEEIDADTYEQMKQDIPTLDWTKLSSYEVEDRTEGSREYACSGDKCEF